MRYLRLCLCSIVILLFIPMNAGATSWVYHFVVWDGQIYKMTEEKVTSIDNEIGAVTKYSDMEQYKGNFSNTYPKGTKYFAIKGIDTEIAIAVQVDKGQYLKAINDGEYTYQRQTNITLNLYKVVGIIALFIVIYILFTSLRKKR